MHRVDIWCPCCYFWSFNVHSPLPSLDFLFEKLPTSQCAVAALVQLSRCLSKPDWLVPWPLPLGNFILEWGVARRENVFSSRIWAVSVHSQGSCGDPETTVGQQSEWLLDLARRTARMSWDLPGTSAFVSYCIWQPPKRFFFAQL